MGGGGGGGAPSLPSLIVPASDASLIVPPSSVGVSPDELLDVLPLELVELVLLSPELELLDALPLELAPGAVGLALLVRSSPEEQAVITEPTAMNPSTEEAKTRIVRIRNKCKGVGPPRHLAVHVRT